MSHKCIRCGAIYEDGDATILRGCPVCGSIFFLYIKTPEDLEKVEKIEKELKKKDKSLEEEIKKKLEEEKAKKKEEKPEKILEKPSRKVKRVKFGVETIRIPKEGVYEINLDALMRSRPVIVLERGKVYFVHLPSVFEEVGKKE